MIIQQSPDSRSFLHTQIHDPGFRRSGFYPDEVAENAGFTDRGV